MTDLLNALYQTFVFFSQNIHIAGWITLVGLAFKLFFKASRFFTDLLDVFDRAKKIEDTVMLVSSNHLPHIQEATQATLEEIKGLRRDILQIFISQR